MTLQAVRHQNLLPASLLRSAEGIDLLQSGPTKDAVKHLVYLICEHKKDALTVSLFEGRILNRVLIYVRTNFAADSLAEKLNRAGITAESVHGNKSQRTKNRSISNFSNQCTSVVVATESATSVLALEADIIINYDLPLSADTYGKRVLRHTSPAATRTIISLCDVHEQPRLININRAFPDQMQLIEQSIG